jgi:hypothetical protein
MDEDIPKRTIVGLLILTVIISMACTWVVLDKSVAPRVIAPEPGKAGSQVRVDIGNIDQPEVPSGGSTGEIAINIK